MRHEAEAVLEGSVDWRSGEAAEEAKIGVRSSIKEHRPSQRAAQTGKEGSAEAKTGKGLQNRDK